ncbi:hypothetical protein ACEPAF_191 [Sanghuangporus sanghuang]
MAPAQIDKFDQFIATTYEYKTVDEHPIFLDILVPKKIAKAGLDLEERKVKCPVMLYFHAGWLVGGQRDFQPWWSRWILDLMVKHSAIVVTADHRLIPEATCEDVLDDIHDVWDWVRNNLSQVVQMEYAGLQPDLSRILLAGSSAGGYCAFQLALSHYETGARAQGEPRPRAALALYPYVSVRTPYWTEAFTKHIFGTPQLPSSILDDHLASIASVRARTGKQPIVTSVPMLNSEGKFTDRALLAVCAQQHGRILELFGPERDTTPGKRRMFPEDRIIDGRKLPPTVIIHGVQDSISPVEGSDLFIEHLQKYNAIDSLDHGEGKEKVLRYFRLPGEHLFETELRLEEESVDWVKDAAGFIEKNWLG